MEKVYSDYFKAGENIIRDIHDTQIEHIEQASQLFAQSIASDGLVHMYGSGHSRMAVEEVFPRYGSFPGFHPIVELSMTFHNQVVGANGQRQAMFIENIEGLANRIMRNFVFKPEDSFLLFSTSGTGNVVIDMALEAQERGLPVVAITGVENSIQSAPKHSTGKKLLDIADIIIDTCVPPGDAAVQIDTLKYPVGPTSTIANTYIVNLIKVRTAELLTQAGQPPLVLTSAHFIGKEASEQVFEETYDDYRRRVWRNQ
ncbi:SIS domain-containing protein [Paenibacillus sp. LS1]|uniref:SIS domain-containing protein n=1 Tax=Paenibacillus sp. LS1 TaxID=2992120 RepID=UPI00223292AA|nr:SIS domain-containing protein [Paenibacillus sp. LS1]MCW3790245.1 SIS domain-containing protein [Paenibacillus sp. LS1]